MQVPPDKSDSYVEQFIQWGNNMTSADDHALVIIGVSRIEHALGELLKSSFVHNEELAKKILEQSDCAGNFSVRIDLCHAMGEISAEVAAELHRLRRIRNKFAHDWSKLSLDSPPVSDMVRNLRMTAHDAIEVPAPPSIQHRFAAAVAQIVFTIENYTKRRSHAMPPFLSTLDIQCMPPDQRKQLLSNTRDGKIIIDFNKFDMSKPNDQPKSASNPGGISAPSDG
jgi:DNA-binding MltR family transcriptional regulator